MPLAINTVKDYRGLVVSIISFLLLETPTT